MKVKSITIVSLFVILPFIHILTGCKPKESSVIQIGATLPLSGDAAVWGKNTQEGIELALAEINASGGVLGKKIVVIYEDTKAQAKEGVSAYQKLTTINKVSAIIDDSVSSVTLAMSPLAEKDQVVILATGATAPKISDAGEFIFRIWNSDAHEGEVTAEYAFTKLGLRNVAILYINNDYGAGLREVFTREFERRGGKVPAVEAFDQSATDMRTQLTKIQSTKPDGLYLVGYPKEIPNALRQAKELGISAMRLGTVAMNDPQLLQVAGDSAEGLLFPYPKEPDGQQVAKFKAGFQKRYGKEPGITSDVGYDAVKMIAKAIEQRKDVSGNEIRQGLNMLKDYLGASGTMTFDEKGDVHKPMGMKKVQAGAFSWAE
jgi:branched-chain amino acid transport system substrate-binding protein